jgi:DNA polymerase-3 subunit delta'
MLGVPLSTFATGQPRATESLRGLVARGRFANAYLFHGPAGVGKMSMALAFARAILCRSTPVEAPAPLALEVQGGLFAAAPGPAPVAKTADAPQDDACGECGSCRKAATLSHPDLKLLFPVTGEEKNLDELIRDTWADLRENPLFVFRYDRYASIRLSQTRELLRDLAYRPFESTRRVVVVRDADRMREDQASALLKSIEEPGDSTIWVLTTARLARLPVTIRSRCQRVRFSPLPESLVLDVLRNRAGAAPAQARLVAALAAGSLARALELGDEDALAVRNQALALLAPAEAGDPAALWKAAQAFMNFGRTGRETLRRMIEFHQLRLRDVLRAGVEGDDAELVFEDLAAPTRALAGAIDATEIRRRLLVLEELLRAIEGNVAPDAAMFSAMARVAGARLGEGEWPPHAAARWNY